MGDFLQRIENLSLRRNGKQVLKQVNLMVRRGEIHGILGLNGAGKSSLAHTIMGCFDYKPDEGRIIFEGKDITHLSITERAKLGITLAWQEPARFEGLRVSTYPHSGWTNLTETELQRHLRLLPCPLPHTCTGSLTTRFRGVSGKGLSWLRFTL